MLISSPQNAAVKRLVALRGRRREREAAGVTLVEGYDEIRVALDGGGKMRELYYCRELMEGGGAVATVGVTAAEQMRLLAALDEGEPVEMGRSAFERAAYREGPDGWLAVMAAVPTDLGAVRLPERPLVLVCEAVEKPGNLGAMLRTADAAGAAVVVAVDPRADWTNPNVVRASKGALFTVPVATVTRDELLAWAHEHGLKVVAATPAAMLDYTAADLSGGVIIAVGAEHEGLTDELMAAADVRVRIPMRGRINSLNVATSAALLLYESLRQRD
jgi:TrmH family RNA methyltransferase